MQALARWRDAAAVLLSLEAFVLALATGIVLYLAWRGVRRFGEWLQPYLVLAGGYAYQMRAMTERVMTKIRAPFVWLSSVLAGLRRALDILGGR